MFASKRGNRIKAPWFDHNGYCLLYKRLEPGVHSIAASKGPATFVLSGPSVANGEAR